MAANSDDVIIIGSGPGGGSVAHRLAPTGKRTLMRERGGPSAASNPAMLTPAAAQLPLAGIAAEAITPLCILKGRGDREAATLPAGFCVATALLHHPFGRRGDLFIKGKSAGREELSEFLKNFEWVGGLMRVALDDGKVRTSSVLRGVAGALERRR